VFGEWLADLADNRARVKVLARVAQLEAGNFGDYKPFWEGLLRVADRLGTWLPRLLRYGRSNRGGAALRW